MNIENEIIMNEFSRRRRRRRRRSDFFDSDEEGENEIDDAYQCFITSEEEDDDDDDDDDINYILPRASMKKVVREIIAKVTSKKYQIAGLAFEILRQEATGYLLSLFNMSGKLMTHAGRKTIMTEDLQLLDEIKRDLCGPPSLPIKMCDYEEEMNLYIEPRKYAMTKKRANKKSLGKKKKKNIRKTTTPVTVETTNKEKKEECNKKRKIEELDKQEEEEANNQRIRREKREELRKKSKQIQEESAALISKYRHNPDEFHYELEIEEEEDMIEEKFSPF